MSEQASMAGGEGRMEKLRDEILTMFYEPEGVSSLSPMDGDDKQPNEKEIARLTAILDAALATSRAEGPAPRPTVKGASPVCLDCNKAGMRNCAHFDECDGEWVYKPDDARRICPTCKCVIFIRADNSIVPHYDPQGQHCSANDTTFAASQPSAEHAPAPEPEPDKQARVDVHNLLAILSGHQLNTETALEEDDAAVVNEIEARYRTAPAATPAQLRSVLAQARLEEHLLYCVKCCGRYVRCGRREELERRINEPESSDLTGELLRTNGLLRAALAAQPAPARPDDELLNSLARESHDCSFKDCTELQQELLGRNAVDVMAARQPTRNNGGKSEQS